MQPVEIAARLREEELNAEAKLMSRDKRLVPNQFVVGLSEHDYDKLTPYSKTLIAELAGKLKTHARDMGYMFSGPIRIHFDQNTSLPTGRFTVVSEAVAGMTPAADRQPPTRPVLPLRPASAQSAQSASVGSVGSVGGPGLVGPLRLQRRLGLERRVGPERTPLHSPLAPPRAPPTSFFRPTSSRSELVLEVNGLRHPLAPPGFVIGRGTDADLRINDPGISRLHAEVKVHPASGAAEIVDLGSTNGITVNGHKVRQAALHRRHPDRDRFHPDAGARARWALKAPDLPMSELAVTAIKVLYLALLWLFILSVVSVIRSDLFGRTVPTPPPVDDPRPQPLEEPARAKKGRRLGAPPGQADHRAGCADRASRPSLAADVVLIGRGSDCQLILDDDYVSTRHARLVAADQGSVRGGPRVDQRHVRQRPADHRTDQRLAGDTVRIGKTVMKLEV